MRILALVPYPRGRAPGQRYRIEQWAPLLEKRGAQVVFEPFRCEALHSLMSQPGKLPQKTFLMLSALWRRLQLLRRIREFDCVFIYTEAAMLGPAFIERLLRYMRVPIVFDFDDAIFLHYTYISPVSRYLRLLKFPGKTKTICQLADHVLAGNPYLAEYASKFNPKVAIVPTTINTAICTTNGSRPRSRLPVIGWTGSYSTLQYLNSLGPTLQQLAKRERFKLRVIGVSSYKLPGVEVEALAWRSATEIADLREIDIGIMPMPDDGWTRGKCGLKALQYMALGIPTICSPVGVNTTIIRDGVNGLLATSEEEWLNQLSRLIHSPDLREKLGKAGKVTVQADYSSAVHAERVFKILGSLVYQTDSNKAPLSSAESVTKTASMQLD